MSCVTKSFIDKMWEFGDINSAEVLKAGVWLVAATIFVRLVAGAFSQLGLHPSSSFSSHLSPLSFCGTCGSGRSLIHCSVMMVGKQEGCWSPGNQWWEPCHPFWGWPWKSLCGCYCLLHRCWACCLSLQRTSWR